MQIQYVSNRSKRNVPDAIGEALIARKIARRVETRDLKPEDDEEISPRTGKPKRRYKRRDMRAED